MPAEAVPYEVALRSIGAYFDEHGACNVNVIETNEGFAIRYQPDSAQPDLHSGDFKYEDLESLTGHLEWRRSPGRSRGNEGKNGAYQDLLRALGHELDGVDAHDILLDEVGDSILITYLKLDPAHSVLARKVMVTAGLKEQQEVLQSAHQRRKAGPSHRGRLDVFAGRPQGKASDELQTGVGAGRTPAKGIQAPWELGEREVYATVLKGVSGLVKNHDACELVLTNRRFVLRFVDGSLHRIRLADAVGVSTNVRREILTKHYRIEVSLAGGDLLQMDCQSVEHMSEVLARIQAARSDSSS